MDVISTNRRKIIRTIDQRNALFGDYKYQIMLHRTDLVIKEIRAWAINNYGFSGMFTINKHWKMVNRTLYLCGDDEMQHFSLKWV